VFLTAQGEPFSRDHLESILTAGERVDGSSLFSFIESGSSDLYLIPRYRAAFVNPFTEIPTLEILCSFYNNDGKPLENLELFEKALRTGELIISHLEDDAVEAEKQLDILRNLNCGRLHFAHISTKKAIELIRQAKKENMNVTCETAPHYFTFTKEDETQNGRFKMNPPLRGAADVQAVINGLQDGTIDCIATDHAPHSLEEKTKFFEESPFGIVGFETALSVSLKLVHDGYLTMNQLIEKMSINPAKILNLGNYGHIKIGQLANLTIIDTDTKYTIVANDFKTKCKITPFEGLSFKGKVVGVVVNGKLKMENGKLKREGIC